MLSHLLGLVIGTACGLALARLLPPPRRPAPLRVAAPRTAYDRLRTPSPN